VTRYWKALATRQQALLHTPVQQRRGVFVDDPVVHAIGACHGRE
jgi:hypothetical protein